MHIRFLTDQDIFTQEHYKIIYFSHKDNFTFFTNIREVLSWESIGLSQERVENITESASNFAPNLINYYPVLINYYPMKIKVDSDDNLPK